MSRSGVHQLYEELNRLVNYHLTEQKLTMAEVIGTLELIKLNLFHEDSHDVEQGEEQEWE